MRCKYFFICILILGISKKQFAQETKWDDNNDVRVYQVSLSEKSDFGLYSFYLNIKVDTKKNSFTLYSNSQPYTDIVKTQLKFPKNFLFALKSKNKRAILWSEGNIINGTLQGKINSSISFLNSSIISFTFNKNGDINGFLKVREQKVPLIGVLKKSVTPIINYSELSNDICKIIEVNFYNPNILTTKKGKEFIEKIKEIGATSNDDLDYLISFYFVSHEAPVSHFSIQKYKSDLSEEDKNVDKKSTVESHNIKYNVTKGNAYIKFLNFSLSDTLIHEIFFKKCLKKNVENLIIDLRECSGGDFSSILFAEYFIPKSKVVGYFLGKRYYENHPNNSLDTTLFQNTESFKGNSVDEFHQIIETKGILKGEAIAKGIIKFDKVIVLIDNSSASSAEPLAWLLKGMKDTELIGKNTAGKMLSSKPFELSHNWYFTLPISDFVTGNYKRLEGAGVSPDFEIESNQALDYAIRKLEITDTNFVPK